MTNSPTLVLVHGAWHGPWCWKQLIDHLPDVEVRAVALPSSGHDTETLGTLYEDAEALSEELAAIDGPTVVVGHSYGGCPVSQAAGKMSNVQRVIYLSAIMHDVGESLLSLVNGIYPSAWDVHKQHVDNVERDYFDVSDPVEVLYGDVDPDLARECSARLGHQSLASVSQPLTEAAWRTVPSTYIICEEDQAMPVPFQEAMAGRAQRIRRIRSSHSPFLSKPAELARVIRDEFEDQ
ncbi:alpha/beta hydrolase [Streptomyces sp. NPDC059224]|uniref:alpha/beta hydrolase n=1 Tax=Streptomyces sp. NPDC059224 TaxID=3346775 RepID=UPI0036C5C9C0